MALRARRRPRRRRDTDSPSVVLVRGAAVIAFLGLLLWLALLLTEGVPLRETTDVTVIADDAGSLAVTDPVRIGGASVGRVVGKHAAAAGKVEIELRLDPGISLPADSSVAIRANGLLGARYVQLLPGTSTRRIKSGGTVRGSSDALTYGVTDALDVLDRPTREGLGQLVDGFGAGLLGHGDALNDALRVTPRGFADVSRFSRAVLEREGAAGRLLPALEAAMGPLARERETIARTLRPLAEAMQPFVDERIATRATLREAPPTLGAARRGLDAGNRLLAAARSVAVSSRRTLPSARRGLRATNVLLRESRRPLRRVAPLLDDARDAAPAVLRVTDQLRPVLEPLRAGLDDLIPIADQVGRYGCDVANFAVNWRSMTGMATDQSGPRGPLGAFRLQIILPAVEQVLGLDANLVTSGYDPPCTNDGGTYPQTIPRGGGR
ncbi:MAG: MlaD family protein [Solirubrobacteraceae bacterium]